MLIWTSKSANKMCLSTAHQLFKQISSCEPINELDTDLVLTSGLSKSGPIPTDGLILATSH